MTVIYLEINDVSFYVCNVIFPISISRGRVHPTVENHNSHRSYYDDHIWFWWVQYRYVPSKCVSAEYFEKIQKIRVLILDLVATHTVLEIFSIYHILLFLQIHNVRMLRF